MAGEFICFSDLFDPASTLASELRFIIDKTIPVQLLTDSKSLFEFISKSSRTSEKRTMLDIVSSREGFRYNIRLDIGFVRSSHNLPGGLSNPLSQASLIGAVSSGFISVQFGQWIIHNINLRRFVTKSYRIATHSKFALSSALLEFYLLCIKPFETLQHAGWELQSPWFFWIYYHPSACINHNRVI